MHPITAEFDARKYFKVYTEGYGDGYAMTCQKEIWFVWCPFHLKYWRSEKVPFLILCQLPCRLYDIKFSSKSKKKNQQRRMWKNKTFFLYFIESVILDIIPASIWELLKSFYKIWFCYRQAGYRIYCKATECSFLYLLDGFDTINFLTPELRNKLHMTTSCLNYV